LIDSAPRELYSKIPIIWFRPTTEELSEKNEYVYKCPVYKTLIRKGDLSSTGHSNNYVMNIRIPTLVKAEKWVKAGVAAMLSLKYD